MLSEELELQEKIRKLSIRIVKYYRGKGPDNVKVNINKNLIVIHIKGILSNLSEILVNQGACNEVKKYWKYIKPHLEDEFLDEVHDVIGKDFDYDWEIHNLENRDREIVIKINKNQ
ncbi:Na-translocating system protein MpsC family protein [Clostridium taeniosporum]|uniref:DUF2294 domain-containing protein n=1 Tax=Clostridium taeniosporum TaxID=394958 RepID=A0A1D7XN46_9CLOT|nr:Na-translocating system protein MpsC family protein [Clostridium taeniosporum]AOR24771.1 DUF2294 domain-containing protein [Clostridium taeniosporum]